MTESVPCSYRLTQDEYNELKAIAESDDRKLAYIVRKAIRFYIAAVKDGKV